MAPLDGVFLVSLGLPSTYRVKDGTIGVINLPVSAGGAASVVVRSVGTKPCRPFPIRFGKDGLREYFGTLSNLVDILATAPWYSPLGIRSAQDG